MRLLIFHGYLLAGTGSNVYNARLAAALVELGHEVHLFSQDRHPETQPFVDAYADWDAGRLRVRVLSRPVRCTAYRPDIGPLLPVYVADRYEGIEARPFPQCTEAELDRYTAANVDAVRAVLARAAPQAALANHLVMGPLIVARALPPGVPYAVKVHGSALEYTVKPHPERFLAPAREGLARARTVLVGSRHTASSLWRALADERLRERTRLGPPGVDVERFRPREPGPARAGVRALAARLQASESAGIQRGAFARDGAAAAAALLRLDGDADRLVAFVGKLIVNKGVDLLIAAWPLVLERLPSARLAVVGFGSFREALERLGEALAAGDLAAAREIALRGRSLEAPAEERGAGEQGEPPLSREPSPVAGKSASGSLEHLLAFLDGLAGEQRERYLHAARALPERVVLTGRLEHDELAELLPACEAVVVPSTFPEAFGMVAVEAAACGALPISAAHSGLAEVSEALAATLPARAARWLSFAVDDRVVAVIAEHVLAWLQADRGLRARTRAALVQTVRERFSWEGVARGVLAAAEGRLHELQEP